MLYTATRFNLRAWLLGCALAVVLAPRLASQDAPDDNPARPAAPTPPGISIPDSPGANERLEKAREKEQQRQWKTAADFYQEALSKYARRVVPGKIDKTAGVFQYMGVAPLVQERLAKWPEEGLTAYRNAYGQTAADLLAAARRDDAAALENIFWTYFITDAGRAAGVQLMDLQLEAGRYPAAAWVGKRLLALHPGLDADRAMVLVRTALADHWSGDDVAATALLDELKQKHPGAIGAMGGQDVPLVDALSQALQTPAPKPATNPTDADSWPSFGGPGGRGEISPSVARPGLSSITIELAAPKLDGLPPQQRQIYLQADATDLVSGQAMGIMPVADGGAIFFQDGRRLYAVSGDSGYPLSGWAQTHGGARAGRYTLDAFGRPRGEQLTVTVTPQRVLAVMGQVDRTAVVVGQGIAPVVRLVCLDRQSGREMWTRTPAELPETAGALRGADFSGTPLLVPGSAEAGASSDSVLVIARAGKGNQFEDCYVVCLSLADGIYKWSTYIGSASHVFDGEIGGEALSTSQLCLAEGRVFVLSNLGTIAAIDPYDGRMFWLSSYPRDTTENPEQAQLFFRNRMSAGGRVIGSKPWANNPVVVTQGKVFALPSDGKHLLVYDAGSGAELKRILTSDYDNADVLLGVKGKAVVLTANQGCVCIDWTRYNHNEPKDARIWVSTRFDGKNTSSGEENAIAGRGFLTSNSVFLPTKFRLYQINWSGSGGGKVVATYPMRGVWEAGQGPGNVLVTSQNVIVAGSSRVDVYRDLELVREQNERRIAEAPTDPEPRVEFAKALFTGGQTEQALAKLDEAIDLIGGGAAMRAGKGREVIFTTTLGFAERSARDTAGEASALTEKLYDRAAAAADTALERAVYRLSRARWAQDRKDLAALVRLSQEILSDEAMRAAAVTEESSAGADAEALIAEALRTDRSVYAPIEQAAGGALAIAKEGGDAQQLLAVAALYPNSKAAVEARDTAASAFEAAGNHLAAIETLRRMYAAAITGADIAGDTVARARLLEAIARNFLATPAGVGPAIDRLVRAAKGAGERPLTKPLPLPGGAGQIDGGTLSDAVAVLRKLHADADANRLPDFHIPLPASNKSQAFTPTEPPAIRDVSALVRPQREFARNDRVLAWSAAGLSVFAVGEITPLSSTPAVNQEPRGAAWMGGKLLVWTLGRVLLINEGGAVQWNNELQRAPMPALASAGDAVDDQLVPGVVDEDGNAVMDNGFVVNGGPRVVINRGRRIVMQGGVVRVIGRVNAGGVAAVVLPAAPVGTVDQVLSARPAGKRVLVNTAGGRLLAINVDDGQLAWQIRLADGPVAQVLVNPHFTVARLEDASGSQLIVIDTVSGRVIGRRTFGGEGSPNQLVNAALSEDGTLVWTLLNKLLVKDLYEPWKQPPAELTGKPNTDVATFAGLNQPEHLLINAGRVLALYDSGRFVSVYNLSGANPAPPRAGAKAPPAAAGTNPLATGATANSPAANISLRLVGERLFIVNGRTLWQYNLADPADHYDTNRFYQTADTPPRVRELFLGRDHSIVVNDPVDRGPLGSAFVELLIYRRGPISATNAREASNLDYDVRITDKAGILNWQAVEGGVYYLSGDQKLHLLQARRG